MPGPPPQDVTAPKNGQILVATIYFGDYLDGPTPTMPVSSPPLTFVQQKLPPYYGGSLGYGYDVVGLFVWIAQASNSGTYSISVAGVDAFFTIGLENLGLIGALQAVAIAGIGVEAPGLIGNATLEVVGHTFLLGIGALVSTTVSGGLSGGNIALAGLPNIDIVELNANVSFGSGYDWVDSGTYTFTALSPVKMGGLNSGLSSTLLAFTFTPGPVAPPWPVEPGPPALPVPTPGPALPLKVRVLPYLKIPNGQGQSVDELEGVSSIASLTVKCVDPSNELKYLATKPEVVGQVAILKMGFEGMDLSDFVELAVAQVSDLGLTTEGLIQFNCRDNLALLDRALWYCGGPQPVALPWLYAQAYTAGQYVQDSNGNIQLCVVGGVSSATEPPVWPGTQAPPWQPNTSYTLGYWALDNANGNLQQVSTVPSGHTSTRPFNTGVSGNGFPDPPWSNVIGGITLDNSGGNPNGPISWTCVAINNILGIEVTDNTITWQLAAMPYRGAFGGSQAFYVYNLFGQTVQVPEPPPRTAFTSNLYPAIDGNPRYIYGNPIDALLVALQNELGLGQDPLLPPIVTTDPNDPQNALVFAPNPNWQQYVPGDDATLITPNPFLRLTNILSLRDNEVAGRKFEWAIKRPVTAKQWIQDEILKPLGLYMFTHNDGTIDLKSMKSPIGPVPVVMDANTINGIPDQTRIPVVNVVTTRGDVDDLGAYSAARVYDAEFTFAQKQSLALYQQEFATSVESDGMREAYDSYGLSYLLADRIFRRHGFSTPQYELDLFLGWVRPELGDYVLLSHPLMIDYESPTGQVGLVKVLCEVIDRQPDYANGRIKLKVLDTRFMQLSKPYDIVPLADTIPNWPLQTAAQKGKYITISFWPGWYSTGDPGNTIY